MSELEFVRRTYAMSIHSTQYYRLNTDTKDLERVLCLCY